ncbi:uncharacterized protein YpbB [Salibacterium salarium]|uniref:helix-turn-helix domain-containing protein n=1 Tax=Salibacterium salarium TaxID=284579 RepID=UPI002789497C|nr:helix-turn-helix domain-containing protein [Salibacterium salarium]MDQ0299476.1 uncharacterized protein YpbB [Salibacterium salarium]
MNNLSFRQTIFLYLSDHLDGERSVNSIFHILTGKRSSQTIQDIKWYNLTKYFHMFPYWKISDFTAETDELVKYELIDTNENLVRMTAKGKQYLTDFLLHYDWPAFFNGWKYGQAESLFWKRVSLLIQCLSYALAKNRSFLPVFEEEEVQQWLKQRWPKNDKTKQVLADALLGELFQLLEQLSNQDAFLFSYRLSGYNYTGLTMRQLSEMTLLEEDECYFRFQAVIHYLLEHVDQTTYLKEAAYNLIEKTVLTRTTKHTLYYLKQGFTMDEISYIRQLKRSTIEDHVVEIASEDEEFQIHQYVSEYWKNLIVNKMKSEKTMKLKTIKEALPEPGVNYFIIRLTLAYYGGNHGNT